MEQVHHKLEDTTHVDSIGLDKLHEKLILAHKLKNYTFDSQYLGTTTINIKNNSNIPTNKLNLRRRNR
jgi:hypothetical protein